jgi:hypothetical protein
MEMAGVRLLYTNIALTFLGSAGLRGSSIDLLVHGTLKIGTSILHPPSPIPHPRPPPRPPCHFCIHCRAVSHYK